MLRTRQMYLNVESRSRNDQKLDRNFIGSDLFLPYVFAMGYIEDPEAVILQETAISGIFQEDVSELEIVGFFPTTFRPFPAGTGQKSSEKFRKFPVGILLPSSGQFPTGKPWKSSETARFRPYVFDLGGG